MKERLKGFLTQLKAKEQTQVHHSNLPMWNEKLVGGLETSVFHHVQCVASGAH